MTSKKVYLAGPIAGLNHHDATYGWREQVYDALNATHIYGKDTITIRCYNPMRGKKFLARVMGHNELGKTLSSYHQQPIATPKAIVGRDRDDVRTADLLIMNVADAKAVSIGTTVELGWADAYRVPVLLVRGKDWENNPHRHLFFEEMATWAVDSVEDAIFIAQQHLIPYKD